MFRGTFISIVTLFLAHLTSAQTATPSVSPHPSPDPGCYAGAYQNEKGDTLILTAEPDKSGWRFSLMDGRTGLLKRGEGDTFTAGPGWSEEKPVLAQAGLGSCNPSSIKFTLKDGPGGTWRRLPLRVTDTHFDVAGARLAGRLIEPVERAPWPLAVIVHGSEKYSAINYYPWSWMMAAQGIAVFVYDKRGTGASTGAFNMNFDILAHDAATALKTARQFADKKISRAGFFGGSQGGWIAPLAATRAGADFLEIGFGLAGSPLDQDAWGIEYELRRRGHGAKVLESARELATITAEIAASNFTKGFDRLEDFVQHHKNESWLREIEGQYTGALLRGELETLRRENPGVTWRYDAMRVLGELNIPQLWVLGAEDSIAPSAPTVLKLQELQRLGKPIDIAIFRRAEHGIVEFVELPDGSRRRTRRPNGLFRLQADWAKNQLSGTYGNAKILPAKNG